MRTMLLVLFLAVGAAPVLANTTFTYQGQLQDGSGPFNGTVEMDFRLYDGEFGGSAIDVRTEVVNVTDGLFQVELDFGDQPFDSGLWLQVSVGGDDLSPRQRIAAAPLAVRALSGGSGGGSLWSTDGNNIYYDGGRVRVGNFVGGLNQTFSVRPLGSENPFTVWNEGGFQLLGVRSDGAVNIGHATPLAEPNSLQVVGETLLHSDLDVSGSVEVEGNVGIGAAPAATMALRVRRDTGTGTIFRVESGSTQQDRVLTVTGHPGVLINGFAQSPQRQLHVRQNTNINSTSGITLQRASPATEQWGLYVATSNNLILVYENSAVGHFDSATGNYTATSDIRLKRDIEPLDDVLDRFLQLTPSSYRMNSAGDNGARQVGLVAQEVQALFPEVVTHLDVDQGEFLGISYDKIAALNTQALIELNSRHEGIVREKQARIAALETELHRQRTETAQRLAALEALLLEERQVAVTQQ